MVAQPSRISGSIEKYNLDVNQLLSILFPSLDEKTINIISSNLSGLDEVSQLTNPMAILTDKNDVRYPIIIDNCTIYAARIYGDPALQIAGIQEAIYLTFQLDN